MTSKNSKKRQLTPEEKKKCELGISRCEKEINDLDYLIEYGELQYHKGLEYNYLKQRRAYKEDIEKMKGELQMKKNTIKMLKDQIENGVIPKETKLNKHVG